MRPSHNQVLPTANPCSMTPPSEVCGLEIDGVKTMTLSCALDMVADDANDATDSSRPESPSTTWLTVCAGAIIMLALMLMNITNGTWISMLVRPFI